MLKVNRNWVASLIFIIALILTYVAFVENAIAATDDNLADIYQSKKYSHLIDILSLEKKENWSLEKSYILFKTYNQIKDYKQSKRVLGLIEHNIPPSFENLLFYEKIILLKNLGEKEEILNAVAGFQGNTISPFLLKYISKLLASEFTAYEDKSLLLRSLSKLVPHAGKSDANTDILRLYANALDYSDKKKGEALLELWKVEDVKNLSPYEKSIENSIKRNVPGFADAIVKHFSSQRKHKNYSYNIENIPDYLKLFTDKNSLLFIKLRNIYFHSMIKKRKYSILINALAQKKNRSELGMNEIEAGLTQFDLMVRKGDTKSAIATLNRLIKKDPRQNLDTKYITLAKYYFNKGYFKQALYFFNRLEPLKSELYDISDIKWHIWRSHFALGNKEELETLADWAFSHKFKNKELGARFCYWGYKLNLYRDGDLFRCYKEFPLTYYGLHSKYTSTQQIAASAVPIPASQVFAAAGNISEAQERQLKFLRLVYLLDEKELADSLVRELLSSTDSNMMLSLANMLLKLERYYLVQVIVESKFRSVLEKNITGRRLLLPYFFPLAYDEEVSQLEDKQIVPKTLILSVMREESHFNPEIKSVAGAVGLMQLMPRTAKYVGKRIGLQIKTDSLVDPKLNLTLGSAYLKQLMKRYKGNLFHTLAAYNGGPTNVKRWIKKTKSKDNDEFVETITFTETQNYVRRVMRTFYIYRDMYENI